MGSISLMDYHRQYIISLEHMTPSSWISRFATWGMSTSEDQQEAETIARRMAARAAQTPGKPRRPALTSLDSTAYEILGVEWNKSGLDSYETLWSRDAALQDVVLPTTFTADKLISAIGNSIKTLVEKIESRGGRQAKWGVEEVIDTTNLRVLELTHNIGEADFSEYAGTSLWNLISLLSNGLKTVEEQGYAIKAELTTMFDATMKMRNGFEVQMDTMECRLNALEDGENQGPDSELVSRIRDLEQLRVGDRIWIESLESRLDTGSDRYKLNSLVSLGSDMDVLAYLDHEYSSDDF